MQLDTSELKPLAPPRLEPVWNYLDLAIVLGWILAPILVLYFAVKPSGSASTTQIHNLSEAEAIVAIVAQLVLYGWVYLALHITIRLRHHESVLPALGWRKTSFNPLATLAAGVVLALLVSGVAALAHTPEVPSPLAGLTNSTLALVLIAIIAATIAPFFEELFFRGFLQPLISRSFGAATGILFTALVFGSLHGPEYNWQWQYAAAITFVGAVLGWVRHRFNSIVPGTLLHGAFNAVAVVALVASKYFPTK